MLLCLNFELAHLEDELEHNECTDDGLWVSGGEGRVQDVTDVGQVGQVDGVLLQGVGSERRVQQVAVQLVEAHAAHVLQQAPDHPPQAHLPAICTHTARPSNTAAS